MRVVPPSQKQQKPCVGSCCSEVKETECVVEHDKVIAYRVTGKIVFEVER